MMSRFGCTAYASGCPQKMPRDGALRLAAERYEIRRATINATSDNVVNAMPVAWINARCTAELTNHNDPSTRSI